MGSMAGHVSTFVILFPVGIRRLHSSLSLQARSSAPFRPRPWYISPDHRLRNADLYALLLLLLLLASASAYATSLLRAASISSFWILLLLLLASASHRLPIPDDFLFFLAALAFLAEAAISHPAASASPIAAHAAELGAAPTIACAAACLSMAVRHKASAVADVALAMGLALKGSWELQAGILLFVLPPRGCGGRGLRCELEADSARVVALLDLFFAAHAVAIAAVCVWLHWAVAKPASRTAEVEAMMARLVPNTAELELD